MADTNVRSDSVDVEQIMRQIRARIREKRGADYTEDELQQLAEVKLQQFLDPRGVRSDLVAAFRKHRGYSPMQFLTECRLNCAHLTLSSPMVGDTVGAIATRYGFSNLGRFSVLYRERYGESPSVVLRKALGD